MNFDPKCKMKHNIRLRHGEYLRAGSLYCTKSSEYGQDVTETKVVMYLKSIARNQDMFIWVTEIETGVGRSKPILFVVLI